MMVIFEWSQAQIGVTGEPQECGELAFHIFKMGDGIESRRSVQNVHQQRARPNVKQLSIRHVAGGTRREELGVAPRRRRRRVARHGKKVRKSAH